MERDGATLPKLGLIFICMNSSYKGPLVGLRTFLYSFISLSLYFVISLFLYFFISFQITPEEVLEIDVSFQHFRKNLINSQRI